MDELWKVSMQKPPVPGRLAVANMLHSSRACQKPMVLASSRCTTQASSYLIREVHLMAVPHGVTVYDFDACQSSIEMKEEMQTRCKDWGWESQSWDTEVFSRPVSCLACFVNCWLLQELLFQSAEPKPSLREDSLKEHFLSQWGSSAPFCSPCISNGQTQALMMLSLLSSAPRTSSHLACFPSPQVLSYTCTTMPCWAWTGWCTMLPISLTATSASPTRALFGFTFPSLTLLIQCQPSVPSGFCWRLTENSCAMWLSSTTGEQAGGVSASWCHCMASSIVLDQFPHLVVALKAGDYISSSVYIASKRQRTWGIK